MKKLLLILFGSGILLSLIAFFITSSSNVVGDKEILAEIERVSNLPYKVVSYDSVTPADLKKLSELSAKDEIAKSLIDEAVWLSSNDEHEHVGHSLYYLGEYVKKAEDVFCLPHELEHIQIYLEHDAIELAEKQIRIATKYQKDWYASTERKYNKFPQYFPKYSELISATNKALENLNKGDYGKETMEFIGFSIYYSIC